MKVTKRPKPEELKEKWYLVDANGKTLGRLATKLATVLIGKDMPTYDPAVVSNSKIIILNADQIKTTGNKLEQKKYYRHSGYPGGLKTTTLAELLVKKPTEVIRKAVSGMLPKNKLREIRLNNLKVYIGIEHPHQAQKPVKLEV